MKVLLALSLAAIGLIGAATPAQAAQGSPTLSATVWAGQVCGSLNTWQNEVDRAVATLQTGNATPSQFEARLDELAIRTTTLSDALQRIGSPDVAQGAAVQAKLVAVAASLRRSLTVDRARAGILARENRAGAGVWLPRLTSRLAAQSKLVGHAFITLGALYPAADLDASFDQTPLCELIHG